MKKLINFLLIIGIVASNGLQAMDLDQEPIYYDKDGNLIVKKKQRRQEVRKARAKRFGKQEQGQPQKAGGLTAQEQFEEKPEKLKMNESLEKSKIPPIPSLDIQKIIVQKMIAPVVAYIEQQGIVINLKDHSYFIKFSEDGKKIAILSREVVRIYSTFTGKLLEMDKAYYIRDKAFIKTFDGEKMKMEIITDNQDIEWSISGSSFQSAMKDWFNMNMIIRDQLTSLRRHYNKFIYFKDKIITIVDRDRNNNVLHRFNMSDTVSSAGFSPDGKKIFAVSGNKLSILLVEQYEAIQWLTNKLPGQKIFLLPDQAGIVLKMFNAHKENKKLELSIQDAIRFGQMPDYVKNVLKYYFSSFVEKKGKQKETPLPPQETEPKSKITPEEAKRRFGWE